MASSLCYDLVVHDDNCQELSREYYEFGERFEEYINRYSEILKSVANQGVKEGQVHNNLVKFIEAVDKLKKQGKDLSESAEKCANEFLVDMDTADSYLY